MDWASLTINPQTLFCLIVSPVDKLSMLLVHLLCGCLLGPPTTCELFPCLKFLTQAAENCNTATVLCHGPNLGTSILEYWKALLYLPFSPLSVGGDDIKAMIWRDEFNPFSLYSFLD